MTNKLNDFINTFLQQLFNHLGIDQIELETNTTPDQVVIKITTPNAPTLIGRHGQTIDAIRRLISLFLLKQNYTGHVFLDINNYYHNKDAQLINHITPLIQQVINTNQPLKLPNLTPRQRRLIHLHCAQIPQITTTSIDSPSGRVLIIKPADSNN